MAIVAAAFAGVRVWQESSVGTGPAATGPAPDGPSVEIAFIANAVEGTVTLIDLDALQAIGTLNVISDGKRVGLFRDLTQHVAQPIAERNGINYAQDTDLSPDGRVLYVARGYLGDVAAFDIASGDLMWRLPVGGFRSDHMAITPDGARLFVSALTDNTVEAIDTATGRKVGSFVTGIFPHDNHITEDGARIYNASLGDMRISEEERDAVDQATDAQGYAYQITVADARSLEVLDRHRFEAGIRPFQVTADETTLYAQLSNTHAVIAYDLEARRIVNRIDLPVAPGVTQDDWDFEAPHHGLAMTEDEQTLCIAGRASDYAGIVSAADLSLIAAIPVGDGPGWSANTQGDRYCLLANSRSDDVSVISYTDLTEVARLPAGRGAKHITVGRVPVAVVEAVKARP